MYLSKLTYRDLDWIIGPIHFSEQSLIVGPNASGKSTVLRCIRDFVRIVLDYSKIDTLKDCEYVLDFDNSIGTVTYSLCIKDGKVESEQLVTNGTIHIYRDEGKSCIGKEQVNISGTTLLLKARRDIEKYPDIEVVLNWVEQMSSFIFSNILSSNNIVSPFTNSQIDICFMWERLRNIEKDAVKEWMQELGYKINQIDLAENKLGEKSLFVIEKDVHNPVIMGKMSNGMYRVLYLLTYLHYIAQNSSGVVLIDDLGEGLDYYRAASLGRKLFSFGSKHNIQLIITSNDNFLVDTVDLSSWILLKRTGGEVMSISEKNKPEEFKKFRKLGLNNFDLIKTDYLVRYFD